jgi:hypothetical protein
MDICSHSFIGTAVPGRSTTEALVQERRYLEREARRAANRRLLQGDLVYLIGWLVAAEVARVTASPLALPADADAEGPSHLAPGVASTGRAQPFAGQSQLSPRRATPSGSRG